MKHRIITCPEWGAAPPRQGITTVGGAVRALFHHTAGHHPEIDRPRDESYEEARRYARQIQHAHMAPGGLGTKHGGIDSGHNFLVCRNGMIFQGRWLTVSAIEARHMVHSAHCPGQNNQIGIEHEHDGVEPITAAQFEASAWLQAWVAVHYQRHTPLPVSPHRRFFPTLCPANLAAQIEPIRDRALWILERGEV